MSGMVEGVSPSFAEAVANAMSPFTHCDFFKCSPELDKLFEALAAAQGEMESAKKNAKNPHFKSNYADLAEVIDACKPYLSKNGLAVAQPPVPGGVVTMLGHKSGQWIWTMCSYKPDRENVQGIGAAQTYGRRYGVQGMVFLPAEDDDGNTAAGVGTTAGNKNPLLEVIKLPIDGAHIAMMQSWFDQHEQKQKNELSSDERKAITSQFMGKKYIDLKNHLGV